MTHTMLGAAVTAVGAATTATVIAIRAAFHMALLRNTAPATTGAAGTGASSGVYAHTQCTALQ